MSKTFVLIIDIFKTSKHYQEKVPTTLIFGLPPKKNIRYKWKQQKKYYEWMVCNKNRNVNTDAVKFKNKFISDDDSERFYAVH